MRPPPSTRSSSLIPVAMRAIGRIVTSAKDFVAAGTAAIADCWPIPPMVDVGGAIARSLTVPHAPHSKHRPVHFKNCASHWEQMYIVVVFVMR